eukprot:TRINITY_DN3426_c0_g1_i1.p1 TRINITY_DN3426_c0_g1~~TRINITY_DN3426_c0_g1_i1.p1  ORF type:complete len:702 (-),score=123.32 TRINITY_DN3426_c0_g1_i1:289-2394(-)
MAINGRGAEAMDVSVQGLMKEAVKRAMPLLEIALMMPWKDYVFLASVFSCCLLYKWFDLHIIQDLFSGLRGDMPQLYYSEGSELAGILRAHCSLLLKRYWPTPWLCSPHLQTCYLHFFAIAPKVHYRRELFRTPDGGTIALDWLDPLSRGTAGTTANTNTSPTSSSEPALVVIVPGLSSNSANAYVKNIAHQVAKSGCRALVANHRGLGGVAITSDTFYNAGTTEDLRRTIAYGHVLYPNAKIAAVGTSLGANILIKYLGEDGSNSLLQAAVAVGNPWDLMIADRFMRRRSKQRLYNFAIAHGLKEFAQMHKEAVSRLANWEHLFKAKSVRDFDDRLTRQAGGYATVDTYYRRCSSGQFIPMVAIPLLCISALDDPICTKEAIPFDECRSNPLVVLCTTEHGGHLSYFEGLSARTEWWVGVSQQFIEVVLDKFQRRSLQAEQPPPDQIEEVGTSVTAEQRSSLGPPRNIEDGSAAATSTTTAACPEPVPLPMEIVGNVETLNNEKAVRSLQPGSSKEPSPAVVLPFKDQRELLKAREVLLTLLNHIQGAGSSSISFSLDSPAFTEPAFKESLNALAKAAASIEAVATAAASIVKTCTAINPSFQPRENVNEQDHTCCGVQPCQRERSVDNTKGTRGISVESKRATLSSQQARAEELRRIPPTHMTLSDNNQVLWQLGCIALTISIPVVGLALMSRRKKKLF